MASRPGESPIELRTAAGTISGTLALPAGSPASPVILLIAGSGPTDGDGNSPALSGRNDCLRLLADALSGQGIASVRYDKRGIGRSAAAALAESTLRFEDYVRDAAAWVAQLSADPRFTSVGILGHSEGALIATLVAQNQGVSDLVLVAGTSQRAADVLRRQLAGRLPPHLAQRSDEILHALERGVTIPDVPTELSPLFRPSVQPYLASWFKYAPVAELAKTRTRCLVVQGDTDIQVEVADAQALTEARPGCRLAIIPGMNHVLKLVDADLGRQLASYGDPTLPIAPTLVRAITDFIADGAASGTD